MPAAIQKAPGGDVNLLEQYVFEQPKIEKRAERLGRSIGARIRRKAVKELKYRRAIKDRDTKG